MSPARIVSLLSCTTHYKTQSDTLILPYASPLTVSRTFHSLFRVLFNFPSRYLFAIGLKVIFSLGWSLPLTSDCIPKQSDSLTPSYHHNCYQCHLRDYNPLWCAILCDFNTGNYVDDESIRYNATFR